MPQRTGRRYLKLATTFVSLLLPALSARAQRNSERGTVLLGVEYSNIHSNLLPGCNCFRLNGGGFEMQARFLPRVAAVADVNMTHAANITPDGYALTQTVYGFGLRYLPFSGTARLQPFAEALLGGAYASGSLSPARTGYGNATAMAVQGGGGLLLRLGDAGLRRWLMLEPVRADYLYTTFHNGSQQQQNDLRLSAGILFRVGH